MYFLPTKSDNPWQILHSSSLICLFPCILRDTSSAYYSFTWKDEGICLMPKKEEFSTTPGPDKTSIHGFLCLFPFICFKAHKHVNISCLILKAVKGEQWKEVWTLCESSENCSLLKNF